MNIEDTMDIDELRRELRRAWNEREALIDALDKLPEVAALPVLRLLSDCRSTDEDWQRGKALQRTVGLEVIPPVSEYERGAGRWSIIREALLRTRA